MIPADTIRAFDAYLHARNLSFEAVAIGGTALALLGVITRPTRDCDILDPELPKEILAAAQAFAAEQVAQGDDLDSEWLNNGPRDLVRHLPPDWPAQLRPLFEGQALRLRTLGRLDLLRSKLFALCDRALDLPDCIALAPTQEELHELESWLRAQDMNPDWPGHVRATISGLQRRLEHGL